MILFNVKEEINNIIRNLIFKPMYPLKIMIIIAIILAVIVILNRMHIINRLLIIALLVLISQRPMLKDQENPTYNLNLDVIFVVDTTVSMNAIDVNDDTRMAAVKKDCKRIVDLMRGSSFALITYDNISRINSPFTDDADEFKKTIDNLDVINYIYAKGSSMSLPYDDMKILLTLSNKKNDHLSIVFFISDGELSTRDASNTNLDKYTDLVELIDYGAVLGYGTAEGAKVRPQMPGAVYTQSVSDNYFILDANKNPVISKMNEVNLKALADKLSVDYYHMPDNASINKKTNSIKAASVVENTDEDEKLDKDIYYYFSGALVVLLVIELFHYRRDER